MTRCLDCLRLERENEMLRRLVREMWANERTRYKQARAASHPHGWAVEPIAGEILGSLGMFKDVDEEAA